MPGARARPCARHDHPALHWPRDALARLQGTIAGMKGVGSDSAMIIEATSIRVRGNGDGLIDFSRAFHRVARIACVR